MPSEFVTLTDGTTERTKGVDQGAGLAAEMVVAVGAGVAGTPAGGVTSVQGVAGGTVLPISDGGGSLTVDGTVALGAGAAVIGHVIVDSGTLTANLGTVAGLALDATLTAGNVLVRWSPSAAATWAPSLFTNFGANATLNVKASAGNVFSCSCASANAAARYLQLHNTATTPAPGAVPLLEFMVPGSGMVIIGEDFFKQPGLQFSTGIAFAFSTSSGTYTAGTAGEQVTQVVYK